MRKMDEMDRNIQLRSESLGYKMTALALCIWTFFNCFQTLAHGAKYQPLPGLILCLSVCVQSFFQTAMKQKMVAGDEEYKEPNKLAQTVLTSAIVAVMILSIGTFLLLKA